MINAERLMMIGGIAAFALTLAWVRRRDLREKYSLLWLACAACLLVCGLFPELLMTAAHWCRLSYPAAVLFVAVTMAYFFAFGVTVALTRYHRRHTRLLQMVALLEHRLARLEAVARLRVHSDVSIAEPLGGRKAA
jgi:hypothetical protein